MFFPFITGKNFTFRIVVEIMLAGWILLALRDAVYRPKVSWILYSFVAFVAIIFFADIFGVNPAKSIWSNFERMEGWMTLAHMFAYFLVIGNVFKTKEIWKWFFHVSIGVSLYSFLFGLFQLEGLAVINQGGDRVDGKFGNATYLAVYMLFHIFITTWYLFSKSKEAKYILTSFILGTSIFSLEMLAASSQPNAPEGIGMFLWGSLAVLVLSIFLILKRNESYVENYIRPLLYVVTLGTQIFILFFTATRGAILGVLGGAFLAGILIVIFERERTMVRRAALGILVAVVAVVGSFFMLKDQPFVQENLTLQRFANISLESGTVGHRFAIWSMAWEGFKERPILGWGQENFNLVFNKNYRPELYNAEPWFDRVHNIVLDWLIAGGVLGFLSYILIPIFLLIALWRAPKERLGVTEKSIITGMIAAYGFHNIFVFDNIVSYILYATMLGYVYSLTAKEPKEESVMLKPIDHGTIDRLVTPAVVIALIFTIYFVNTKSILANTSLIDALRAQTNPAQNITLFREAIAYDAPIGKQETREQLVQAATRANQAQVDLEIRQEVFTLAVEEMEQFIEDNPGDARLHLFLGSLLENYRQFERANGHFVSAQEASPNKQTIRFTLAGNLINLGRTADAQALMEETLALEEDFAEAHIMYAVTAIYNDEQELADQILLDQYGKTVVNHPRLVQAYGATRQFDKVRDIWQERVNNNPNNVQFRLSLAAAYLQLEDRPKAVEIIREVIEIDPNFTEQGNYLIREIEAGRNP